MIFSYPSLKNKVMKNIIIGIDVSSKTLDICVKTEDNIEHFNIKNTPSSIQKFFKPFSKQQLVVAMENTGRYNWNLYQVMSLFNFKVYVIHPLHLSKSLGFVRGKNDKIDALRIALFIEKNQSETKLWKPTPKDIQKLKVLLTERNSRIKIKCTLATKQHDYKLMKMINLDKELSKLNKQLAKQLDHQIAMIEKQIEILIKNNQELKQQDKLIRSVPGVGKILSWNMIAKTEGFTKITDPRKMACFSGVVPFEHQSGTTIYRKPNDLGIYYRRKVNQGKNKMSVVNAVRNKIIHRIFAVIKNQTFYQNRLVTS